MNTHLMTARVDSTNSAATIFSPDGLEKLIRFSEIMATSRVTVPAHLTGKPSDCLAVALQAVQWNMNPFAVAQKTFMVNGILGYEAQLINAVITTMSPTKDRLQYEWFGPWEKVIGKFMEKTSTKGNKYIAAGWSLADESGCGVRVWATMKNEQEPRQLELLLSQAQVRNSTLWASDPKQQLAYLAVKRWARLHCPDVILGVYTPDEIEPPLSAERDITAERKTSELNALINHSTFKAEPTESSYKAGKTALRNMEALSEASSQHDISDETLCKPFPESNLTSQPELKKKSLPTEVKTRTPDELLADFCEAAMNSKNVSELAKCYAYASKVLTANQPLLEKATDVFLVRKAELEENAKKSSN